MTSTNAHRARSAAALLAGLATLSTAGFAAADGHYGDGSGAATCRTNAGVLSYKLGEATLTTVSDGFNNIPLSYLFVDTIPIIERVIRYTDVFTIPDDPDDEVPFEANVVLLEYRGLNILLDGGGGGFIPDQGTLPAQLAVLGLAPEDIDHILITHGHFDHIGGLLVDPDGEELTFPNAKVHLAKEELEYWFRDGLVLTWGNDAQPEGLQQVVIDIARNVFSKIPEDMLVTYSLGDEVVPGVTADMYATWHTPGSTIFKVAPEGAKQPLYVLGDSIAGAGIGLEAPWVRSAFDDLAEEGPAGKYKMLDAIAADNGWVHGYHAPYPSVFAVIPDGLAFRGVRPGHKPGVVGQTCSA